MSMLEDITAIPHDFVPSTKAELASCLPNWEWRMFSGYLYKIIVKEDDEEGGQVMPFKPNRAQRRFLKRLHHRNVILKARQLGFCLEEQTRVLTADLRWVPICDLRPGDEVVSVDERVPGGRGAARKMRTATVQAARQVRRMGYRITFSDGREVVCTDQHPWLARAAAKQQPFWRAMDRAAPNAERSLKVGHQVRSICTPWDAADVEDGWFGGMIDGEGSLSLPSRSGASVCVSQRPGPVWDRLVSYAKSRGYHYRIEADGTSRASKFGDTPVPKLVFSRSDEIFRLMGQTRPTRGLSESFRFWEGKELPGKRNADNSAWNEIVSIDPVGMVDMIDLQTSTGTFIAEGMVSHNTTLIAILFLDHALFAPNQRCGIICHTLTAAEAIFRDKVKFAYDNLPPEVKEFFPLERDAAEELLFAHNNSSIRVATSMRSGTIHRLHISELGKISKESRKHAREIVTGSLPAVPKTGIAVIESTSEGPEGEFYKIASKAQTRFEAGQEPLLRQFAFHFFPWFQDPGYETDPTGIAISPTDAKYFATIEAYWRKVGDPVSLSPAQRAWYVMQRDEEFSGDQEMMWQEFPSTPDECWRRSTEGTFLAEQLKKARAEDRITVVPHIEGVQVHTFWDIGARDGTAIWLMQYVGMQHRFIGFIEDWDKGYAHYVKALKDTGYLFGVHFLPHDADAKRQLGDRVASPVDMLREIEPRWTFEIVPRVQTFTHGINILRQKFPEAWFDEAACKAGIEHLTLFRKRWNATLQVWGDEPDKDNPHTEAADALRQWATGFDPALIGRSTTIKRRARGGMAV
ncbi:Hint domain-containing protein [Mesobacterium pallidum]|uniref:Hint domain-containing protein n=1 Tax=Mesobacterium pallidum TaxID=2872037 RepID=UPI001EE26EF2|nr:Hint domain-containing protein [Mesobacterium pallidum]